MSQNRRNYRQTAYEKRSGTRAEKGERSRNSYVYGSTAYELDPESQWEAEPKKQVQPKRQVQPAVRKNREKANHMSAGYVLFLAAALCAAAFILVNYIQLQAELTNLTKMVAARESELNTLRDANDEQYNRISNSINLEEIKRIAIGELGMTYAQEGQIITYNNEGDDYMRQVQGSK